MGGFFDLRDGVTLKRQRMSELGPDSHPEILKMESLKQRKSTTTPAPETNELVPRILITEEEIEDKSKADAFTKGFAMFQISWFIVQYVARWANGDPRTQLEVVAFSFTAINILIYILWWDKPFDVQKPLSVSSRASPIIYSEKGLREGSILGDALKSFTESMGELDDSQAWVIGSLFLVGILFGGVHCFAWHFHFPTRAEELLWRVSAVYCTAYPAAIILALPAIPQIDDDAGAKAVKGLFRSFPAILIYLSAMLYLACRFILLAITFSCLRAPPVGIFHVPAWILNVPHIG